MIHRRETGRARKHEEEKIGERQEKRKREKRGKIYFRSMCGDFFGY